MKKIILLICVVFICNWSFSQEKSLGIGVLKLYSDIDLIYQLGYNEQNPKIKNYNDYFQYVYKNKTESKVYESMKDSLSENNFNRGYYNPETRLFYIPKFKLLSDLYITGVELVFFKNKLVKIKCDGNSELNEALDIKYGKADLNAEHKDKQFTYTYTGATVTKTEDKFRSTWNVNNDNVKCSELLWKYYNDKGEEQYIHNFEFYDMIKMIEIDNIESQIKNRIQERKENEKKKKYDEL